MKTKSDQTSNSKIIKVIKNLQKVIDVEVPRVKRLTFKGCRKKYLAGDPRDSNLLSAMLNADFMISNLEWYKVRKAGK